MKIYSWNVLFENKKLDEVFSFIEQSDFDVFALQEVPDALLTRLEALPVHCAVASEWELITKGVATRLHTVILSRLPFASHDAFPFPIQEERLTMRGRFTKRVLEICRVWTRIDERRSRNGVFADIRLPNGGHLRVFSIHLSLPNPHWREEELLLTFDRMDSTHPTVICGDFNVLESRHVNVLGWLMGGPFLDALLAKRERRRVEALFAKHGLQNPLYGMMTHPFSRSQLDHILLSTSLPLVCAGVVPQGYGSDHRPVFTEFKIPTHL